MDWYSYFIFGQQLWSQLILGLVSFTKAQSNQDPQHDLLKNSCQFIIKYNLLKESYLPINQANTIDVS